MWKYVSRRIKDTFEKGCNIFEVRKSWTCCEKAKDNAVIDRPSCYVGPCHKESSTSGDTHNQQNGHKDHYRNFQAEQFHTTCIEAATWSSALIFGWYTSRLFCRPGWKWNGKSTSLCSRLFMPHIREIHDTVIPQVAWAQPLHPNHIRDYSGSFRTYNINYEVNGQLDDCEHIDDSRRVDAEQKVEEEKLLSLDDAAANLKKVAGDIEHQLGSALLSAGRLSSGWSLLRLGAIHNSPAATYKLGLCYEQGLGVPKDYKIASECYQQAANLGNANALYNLGIYHIHGRGGVAKDHNQAYKLFVQAANLGQKEAIKALGWDQESLPINQVSSNNKTEHTISNKIAHKNIKSV